ncbi:hypothetical protein [Gordonia otitidis]|uniref:Uncharacterized protein n=1 Tax=Gordonia otitidis (strain DSM 44809 / CCUG 52243 / JCM 12355 / NBRC 100426 / IFM 10032) TaxID=1108044 RepID=H5TRT0_GORO1|nr:hypothetical protein [Gordonia otitidis]GAB36188.1 hypothetical protein GOOTI_202_00440 [Gordonia otitidis NBRC 100426]
MSDRTCFQIVIYAAPDNEVTAIEHIFEQYDIGYRETSDSESLYKVVLGAHAHSYEIRCGSATDISQELIRHAPGSSWELWEDPAYEWLGDVHRYTPELGLFAAECTSEGCPVFTVAEVLQMVTQTEQSRLRALGEAHRKALTTLGEAIADV